MKIFELDIFWFTLAPSYYGLMYALWFLFAYYIIIKRKHFSRVIVDDLFLYVFAWVIIWWRLGYILFYNLSSYLENPIAILQVWEWGMSFHGGAIWVIIAVAVFCKQKNISFLSIIDEIALTVPIGLWLGRIWNYLNGELLGYGWYTGPFSVDGRFPSPLVEALLEWLILWSILYFVARNRKFAGQIWALFLIGYWVFRMAVEILFRVPDAHIGYLFWRISVWALLSLFMVIIWWLIYYKLQEKSWHQN